jgi:hypothetical protein
VVRFNATPDRIVSAIVLIVVGLLQTTGAYAFPLWLVVILLGVMIMMER